MDNITKSSKEEDIDLEDDIVAEDNNITIVEATRKYFGGRESFGQIQGTGLRLLVWNVRGINDETPLHVANDIASMIVEDAWDLVILVEAPQSGSNFWKRFRVLKVMQDFYVSQLWQTVCIARKSVFGAGPRASNIENFDYTHKPADWSLRFKETREELHVIAVHLKAEGKVKSPYRSSQELRKAEFQAILDYIKPKSYSDHTMIVGDFNFGIAYDDISHELRKPGKKFSDVFTSLIELDYGSIAHFIPAVWSDVANWKNTFIDDRKNKISDIILVSKILLKQNGRSGVVKPDHTQEKLVNFKISSLGQFAVVKTSYFRRARFASYTDHWPVFAMIPSK